MKAKWGMVLLTLLIAGCKKDSTSTATGDNTVTVNSNSSGGEILLSVYNSAETSGKATILNGDGVVIKEKETEGIVMNFQKWAIDGKTRYTYLVKDNNGYQIPDYSAYIPGYQVIADENLDEIKRVYLLPYNGIATGEQNLLDAHDFILLADDHYMVMSYYYKQVNNIPSALNPAQSGVYVVAPIIQEIQNDQVIWQWDGTEHTELYSHSVEGNNYQDSVNVQDYLHMNSMAIDPADGNLVCSFRNADQLLKINRKTGAIVWSLGGVDSDFPLGSDNTFLRQHHATFIDNNTLMIFDNGHIDERPYTRILELQLNENTHTVDHTSSFTLPSKFVQYMGSVQKFDSTYFIGGGSSAYIMEVNFSTSEIIFEMTLSANTYRAFKYY